MTSYGPIITVTQAEQAVTSTLQAWIDTVLGELERNSSGRWTLRQIQRPRSWVIQSEYHDIPERHLPAINVESPGMASDPEVGAGGAVNAEWAMTVQGVVKGQDRVKARELMGVFEAAIRTVLHKHGDLGGFADGTTPGAARYDLIPPDRDRTLVGFEIPIVVSVSEIGNRYGGPSVPDDPPPTPLPPTSPDDPAHTSTTVVVTGERFT